MRTSVEYGASGRSANDIVPPCTCMHVLAMARPSPVPLPAERAVLLVTNGSNACARMSLGTPCPSSATETRAPSRVGAHATRMVTPRGLCL